MNILLKEKKRKSKKGEQKMKISIQYQFLSELIFHHYRTFSVQKRIPFWNIESANFIVFSHSFLRFLLAWRIQQFIFQPMFYTCWFLIFIQCATLYIAAHCYNIEKMWFLYMWKDFFLLSLWEHDTNKLAKFQKKKTLIFFNMCSF
jgi:hypothetical protein